MAVTTLAKPGDFMAAFVMPNRSTADIIQYGITADGKVYRERRNHDSVGGPGGRGSWVDTGLTIPDLATPADM
jgi:hypothetical protein